jgi:sec-independent protein translocase protein TatA
MRRGTTAARFGVHGSTRFAVGPWLPRSTDGPILAQGEKYSGDARNDDVLEGGGLMFRNGLEPWHLLVVALVVILLFGSRKLPDTARAVGKSLRILKSETRAMKDEAAGDTTAEPEVAMEKRVVTSSQAPSSQAPSSQAPSAEAPPAPAPVAETGTPAR